MFGFSGQRRVSRQIAAGTVGTLEGSAPARTIAAKNGRSDRCGVWQLIPLITLEPRSYSVKINDVNVSATGETLSELGANMAIALNSTPSVHKYFRIDVADTPLVTGLITLTHRHAGMSAKFESGDFLVEQLVLPRPPSYLPFGRLVGRKADWTVERDGTPDVWLLESAEQSMVGVSMQTYLPQSEVDLAAKTAYPPRATIEVVTRCGSNRGIWVEVEPGQEISWLTPLCSSLTPGYEGAIALDGLPIAVISIEKLPVVGPDGRTSMLIYF
jgi:hypothetical protein